MTRPSGKADRSVRVGVISDTHGVLPDAALEAFAGVDGIVHAGDVGGSDILGALRAIAPVTAVRGNCDNSGDASLLPEVANVAMGGVRFLIGHQRKKLLRAVDSAAGVGVVVTGHSHKAHAEEAGGVLYLNPGSAGDPRGGRPATVAIVEIDGTGVGARIVEL